MLTSELAVGFRSVSGKNNMFCRRPLNTATLRTRRMVVGRMMSTEVPYDDVLSITTNGMHEYDSQNYNFVIEEAAKLHEDQT